MSPTDKAEIFARRIVSRITEGNTKETFEADVLDVAADLREFARSLEQQPDQRLHDDDPDPSEAIMDNERVFELLNQIERNARAIYVRERLEDGWQNVSLIELPTHLAIKHTCRIVRKMVFLEARTK